MYNDIIYLCFEDAASLSKQISHDQTTCFQNQIPKNRRIYLLGIKKQTPSIIAGGKRSLTFSLEPRHEKKKKYFVYAKTKAQFSFLVCAFVFATGIVRFLNSKFSVSSHHLWMYSHVCVRPVLKPRCWFSNDAAYVYGKFSFLGQYNIDQLEIDGNMWKYVKSI